MAKYLGDCNAATLVVESEYIDRDYLDDFASYYATCFREYARKCRRLHFFTKPFDEEQFLNVINCTADPSEALAIQASYLGFVVARPLPSAIIGRTALKTYETDGGRRNYTCTTTYSVTLFGLSLKVVSLAFQEQDAVLAACATVALWCSFHKTAEIFKTPIPTPARITRSATELVHLSRPIPSKGLVVQQICDAIRSVGLEPEIIQVQPNTPLISLVYSHLVGGVPVILGLEIEGIGHHAVTAAGYSLQSNRHLTQEVATGLRSVPMVGLRINEFYVHDDQIGPFSRLKIGPSSTVGPVQNPVTLEGSWTDRNTGRVLPMYPRVVIVPAYHKIRVTFLDVQQWVTRLHQLFSAIVRPNVELEWDVRLTTTNEYKTRIRNSLTIGPELRRQILLAPQPRFLWVCSLSNSATRLFELVVDATDMARSFPVYSCSFLDQTFKTLIGQIVNSPTLQQTLRDTLSVSLLERLKQAVL